MRWSVSAYGALAGVVALAGCSSSDVKEYRSNANAACAVAHERAGKSPSEPSVAEIARSVKREIAARSEAIATLEELVVPIDIEGAHAVVDDLKARQERAHEVEKAAKDEDRKKLRELEAHEAEEFEVEAERARELGLNECAEL